MKMFRSGSKLPSVKLYFGVVDRMAMLAFCTYLINVNIKSMDFEATK